MYYPDYYLLPIPILIIVILTTTMKLKTTLAWFACILLLLAAVAVWFMEGWEQLWKFAMSLISVWGASSLAIKVSTYTQNTEIKGDNNKDLSSAFNGDNNNITYSPAYSHTENHYHGITNEEIIAPAPENINPSDLQ